MAGRDGPKFFTVKPGKMDNSKEMFACKPLAANSRYPSSKKSPTAPKSLEPIWKVPAMISIDPLVVQLTHFKVTCCL